MNPVGSCTHLDVGTLTCPGRAFLLETSSLRGEICRLGRLSTSKGRVGDGQHSGTLGGEVAVRGTSLVMNGLVGGVLPGWKWLALMEAGKFRSASCSVTGTAI